MTRTIVTRVPGSSVAASLWTALFVGCALGATACKQVGPPKASESAPGSLAAQPRAEVRPDRPNTSDATAGNEPVEPVAPAEPVVDAAVLSTLKAMSVRTACNRVMGCKPAAELLGHGAKAIPALQAVLQRNPRLDKWWLVKAVDVIGQLNDPAAVPVLTPLLTDWRPELRAKAALALGRIGHPSARPALLVAANLPDKKTDPATRGAIDFALARTARGRAEAGTYRASFLSRWPQTRAASDKTLATIVGLLAEVARQWPAPEALPRIRDALEHPSSFARIEAIRAVGQFRDKASIPSLIRRLDDPLPSQRRAAMQSLGRIANAPSLTTVDAWKRWCDKRRCLSSKADL